MSLLTAIAMYAIWASLFTMSKVSLAFSTPAFITACRTILAAFLLLSYVFIKKKASFRLKGKQWALLFLFGLFAIYLTGTCEFAGLQYTSPAKASFIFNFAPIFSAILSYFHFKEKINALKWTGLTVAFFGILPVLFTETGSEEVFYSSFLSLPNILVTTSVFFSVYGWILLKKVLLDSTISSPLANGIGMLFGGGLALSHSLYFDTWTPLPIAEGGAIPHTKLIITMTLLSNVFCYNLYAMLLKKYTATFLSLINLLTPLFTSFLSWAFLREPLSPTIFTSTGIVSIGLLLVYYSELKQGYIPKNHKLTSSDSA
jgi:drug/metabolite transporter (DMT)-like permease